jgi:Xaa-Pro aminopeptidase
MISMEPVLKRGYTAWDQDVLPRDEFAGRLAAVRSALAERKLDALVIVNYSLLGAMFGYADIAYLGGLQSGGALVVTHEAQPVLLTFGGGRELAFTREQTWIENVVAGRGRTFETAAMLLNDQGVAGGAVGIVGLDGMPAAATERFRTALAAYEQVRFDNEFAEIRAHKRPRELMALSLAKGIAEDAVSAAARAFAAGGDNTAAMIEAERVARLAKARDVRVLVNMNARELRPFEGRLAGRHEPLVIWVAAQYQGYWAEATLMSDRSSDAQASAGVDAMAEALRADAAASDVARAGLAALPGDAADEALAYGLGATIGLAQNEGIAIRPDSTARIPLGSVVSLVTFVPGRSSASIASRMLTVGASRAVPLNAMRLG